MPSQIFKKYYFIFLKDKIKEIAFLSFTENKIDNIEFLSSTKDKTKESLALAPL